MKKALSFILAISIIFSCMGILGSAAEISKNYYYFDSVNGDDNNSGTDINSPIRTLAGLKELDVKPGTHFLFRCGGEYEVATSLTCSGTKKNPVVISSYGKGEKPLLYTNEKTEVFKLFDCSYITI